MLGKLDEELFPFPRITHRNLSSFLDFIFSSFLELLGFL